VNIGSHYHDKCEVTVLKKLYFALKNRGIEFASIQIVTKKPGDINGTKT
jgi:hypothetical protein